MKVGDCREDELAGRVLRGTLKMQCVRVRAIFVQGRMWFSGKTVTSKFSFHVYRNRWRKASLRSEGLSSPQKARYSMVSVVVTYLHISVVGLCVSQPSVIVQCI